MSRAARYRRADSRSVWRLLRCVACSRVPLGWTDGDIAHGVFRLARLGAPPAGDADRCRRRGVPGGDRQDRPDRGAVLRSEEHTSELQSLMRISYAVFCLKKKKQKKK